MLSIDDAALSDWARLVAAPGSTGSTWLLTIGSAGAMEGASKIGLIADTETLVAQHVWTYVRAGGATIVRPSPLLQSRCVDPAVQAMLHHQPALARRRLELVVRSFAEQRVDTLLAACLPKDRRCRPRVG